MLRKIIFEDEITLWWEYDATLTGRYECFLDGKKYPNSSTHISFTDLTPDAAYEVKIVGGERTLFEGVLRTKKAKRKIDVTKAPYFAIGDGETLNTKALQRAFDDCGESDCVYFPAGVFLSGALTLHSDTEVYFEEGCVLQGTACVEDYLPKIKSRFEGLEVMAYRSLLNAGELDSAGGANCKNILLRGHGRVVGGGDPLRENVLAVENRRLKGYLEGLGDKISEYETPNTLAGRFRPRLINISNVENFTICGLGVESPPSWNLHMTYSTDLTVYRCFFRSHKISNGDGIDPDSVENCAIFDCRFETSDDCIAIKSGRNPEGNIVNRKSKDIYIFDCSGEGHGISVGSEMSGGVENVYVWDCNLARVYLGLQLKYSQKRGGYIKNVHVDNCVLSIVSSWNVSYNNDGEGADAFPQISDFYIRDCTLVGRTVWGYDGTVFRHIVLEGFDEEHPVENVLFERITLENFENEEESIVLKHTENVRFNDLQKRGFFRTASPESVGVESKCVHTFLAHLEDLGLSMHDVLLSRGKDIFCEAYWEPFHREFRHRQYSQTKSFVGIAIGLLEEEGKLRLTDRIADYFRDRIDRELPAWLEEQTIEDMLTMRTAVNAPYWFTHHEKDRVRSYFNYGVAVRPAGTTWQYDSAGSQVLSALVEKLSGKSLLEYLKEKLFNEMGVFQTAEILKTPTGESWGDSALLCTARDMLSFARLLMNKGVWKGKRLMNAEYIEKATSAVVSNATNGHINAHNSGYGYQIWRVEEDAFAFIGMGQQLTVCYPKYDLIFVCNSDCQGAYYPYDALLKLLRYDVVNRLAETPFPENVEQNGVLNEYISSLKLRAVKGVTATSLQEKIHGKKFVTTAQTPHSIKNFTFFFDGQGGGKFCFENEQGEKELAFKINENAFGKFPQKGYSWEYGGIPGQTGYLYDCAASLAFKSDSQLVLFIQVIDKYFGNLSFSMGFAKGYVNVWASKTAENFFQEFEGEFVAKTEEE